MAGKAKRRGHGRPGAAEGVDARERLLSSAAAVFTRKGYAAATVREIVAAAGVTKPVLYYYFRNKEGIFLELMKAAGGTFDALIDASLERPGSARERIEALSLGMLDLFDRHIDVARLMYAIYYGPPQGAPHFDFDAFHLRFRDVVTRLVREGIRNGEFRKAGTEDMTWAVIGPINVAMEVRLCHPEVAFGKEGLSRMLDILFEGMSARGRKRRGI